MEYFLKFVNKRQHEPPAAMPVQLKKSTGGEEDPHSPRLAIEFLMNQMRQYAKRYISMCPAQLRSKDHTTVGSKEERLLRQHKKVEFIIIRKGADLANVKSCL